VSALLVLVRVWVCVRACVCACSESARARWTIDSSCDAGDSYIDEGHGAMLVVVESPAFEKVTLTAKVLFHPGS
jgi:hypothetical protein